MRHARVRVVGPELRSTGKTSPSAAVLTPEQRPRMIEGTVATQFETIMAAAVAEKMGVPVNHHALFERVVARQRSAWARRGHPDLVAAA